MSLVRPCLCSHPHQVLLRLLGLLKSQRGSHGSHLHSRSLRYDILPSVRYLHAQGAADKTDPLFRYPVVTPSDVCGANITCNLEESLTAYLCSIFRYLLCTPVGRWPDTCIQIIRPIRQMADGIPRMPAEREVLTGAKHRSVRIITSTNGLSHDPAHVRFNSNKAALKLARPEGRSQYQLIAQDLLSVWELGEEGGDKYVPVGICTYPKESRGRPKISSPQLSPKLTDTLHATSLSSQERRNAERNHASVSLAQLQAVNRGDIPHDLSITSYLYTANRRNRGRLAIFETVEISRVSFIRSFGYLNDPNTGRKNGRRKTRQCNYRSRSKSDSNESIVHG